MGYQTRAAHGLSDSAVASKDVQLKLVVDRQSLILANISKASLQAHDVKTLTEPVQGCTKWCKRRSVELYFKHTASINNSAKQVPAVMQSVLDKHTAHSVSWGHAYESAT